MSARPIRLVLVLVGLALGAGCLAASASAGPLLGRWEGYSAKGVTVAFLLGEYHGEVLIADAGVLCPPGGDPEDADPTARAGQLDAYFNGKGKSAWRTLQRVEDGVIDTSNEASWYSGKLASTGVLGDPSPSLAQGSLGHSTGVITKIARFDLPCRVGKVRVHHVTGPVRADGSYGLAALPAGNGHVSVTAGGAFLSLQASLTVPALDPEDPAPCLPFYATETLETHGGGDAFATTIDEPSVAYPENQVAITGAFTGHGTIVGGFVGKAAFFDPEHECPILDTFVAKAPSAPVRPPLKLTGTASGGQAG